jgi:hypothetical protein
MKCTTLGPYIPTNIFKVLKTTPSMPPRRNYFWREVEPPVGLHIFFNVYRPCLQQLPVGWKWEWDVQPAAQIYQFSDLSCPNRKLLQIGTKYVMLASPNYLSVTMRRFPLLPECFALICESFALLCVYYTKVWRDSRKALVITRNFRINSRNFLVIIRKFSVITQ